jgi:hypothetical protein
MLETYTAYLFKCNDMISCGYGVMGQIRAPLGPGGGPGRGYLALRVIEVSRHSDDGLADLPAKVLLSSLPHLSQSEGTDLAGRVLLASGLWKGPKEKPFRICSSEKVDCTDSNTIRGTAIRVKRNTAQSSSYRRRAWLLGHTCSHTASFRLHIPQIWNNNSDRSGTV